MRAELVPSWAAHSGHEQSWCVPRCKHVAAWVQVSHPSLPPCRCTGVQRHLHTDRCLSFTNLHTRSKCKSPECELSLSFCLFEANNQLRSEGAHSFINFAKWVKHFTNSEMFCCDFYFCIPYQYLRLMVHLFALFHLVTGMLKVTQQENARGDLAITRWQPECSPPKYYCSTLASALQGIIKLQLVVTSCYLADTKGAKSSAFGRLTRAAG